MFFSKIKILRSHGRQYIPDLGKVEIPAPYRGRPRITGGIGEKDALALVEMCPTGAIGFEKGLTIDLGRCVFCGECARKAPQHIAFTQDYRMGTNTREGLIVTEGEPAPRFDPAAIKPGFDRYFREALKLRQVSAGGDNSTEMELNASGNVNFDFARFGVEFVASPRHADGVVVTGPVTKNMAPALLTTYKAVPQPRILILAGAEAISGGLFAPSRCIDRAFLEGGTGHNGTVFPQGTPVDLYLPGAPVHPMTFIEGVTSLRRAAQGKKR